MTSQIDKFKSIAKKNPKKIILPEGNEDRILEAAKIIESQGIAQVSLIAKGKKGKNIIDPEKYSGAKELIDTFYALRKHKGITEAEARETVLNDPVYFGALLVGAGAFDGFVAGASYTTSDVARAALYCLGVDKEIGVMSSSFIIEMEDSLYGDNGLFIFADCGIVPNPNAERLAGIAISSSRLYESFFKRKPCVALLSYSTKGSAKGESVEKVIKALELTRKKAPDLEVDGEIQLDAAIIPEVAKIKAPKSPVAGRANVLIFPNLDAGNIACKLIQRLGKARVVGPLLQGLNKPASDLSRGSGVSEIVDTVAATVVRAQ